MHKSGVPEDLEEMIRDILAYEALEKYLEEQNERELLYAELPCYEDVYKEEWKIEISI